jgi:hypothetical protein
VPGSNHYQDTGWSGWGFSWLSSVPPGTFRNNAPIRLLAFPFKSLSGHCLFYISALCSLDTDSVLKKQADNNLISLLPLVCSSQDSDIHSSKYKCFLNNMWKPQFPPHGRHCISILKINECCFGKLTLLVLTTIRDSWLNIRRGKNTELLLLKKVVRVVSML